MKAFVHSLAFHGDFHTKTVSAIGDIHGDVT